MSTHGQGIVVLMSGGMDSSVLVHYVAKRLGKTGIHAVSFNYGQRHSRELACAAYQAKAAGAVEHRILDISFLGPLLREGSVLLTGGGAVPDLKDVPEEERTQPPTYVPNRNMMLLSMAAAYAEAHGMREVYYGAQAQDEYGYWDCTNEFLERINGVLALNRKEAVRICAPFVDKSKSEIVGMGVELGVDFSHTWSCYRGEDKACGTCPTCVERLNAFKAAGMEDPVEY